MYNTQYIIYNMYVKWWLSRFKLIRLRRISLATLPRYGLMDGYQYMYIACLRQVVAFAPKVINYCLPPAGVLRMQNKVINAPPRRHTREGQRWGFIDINDMYNNDVGKGGAQGCEAYEVK